jgi:hypothetical protein
MYSSVWNWHISCFVAGFALCGASAGAPAGLWRASYVNFHFLVKAIVHYQAVGHSYSVRLHRVTGNVGVVPVELVSHRITARNVL